jgi:hypothetical protein
MHFDVRMQTDLRNGRRRCCAGAANMLFQSPNHCAWSLCQGRRRHHRRRSSPLDSLRHT